MKIVAPLACLAALLLALVFFSSSDEPQQAQAAKQPVQTSGVVHSNSSGSSLTVKSGSGVTTASSGKYGVSDDTILATVNDSITRLKPPLGALFKKWNLDDEALQDVLDALHDKSVAQLRFRSSGSQAMEQKLTAEAASQRSAAAEAKIVSIVGGIDRFREMTAVITQSNMAQYQADAPARRQSDQWAASRLVAELETLKSKYGSDYKQEFRKKYGEESADKLLKLVERTAK